MAAVDATAVSQEGLEAKAWEGFTEGNWQKDIDKIQNSLFYLLFFHIRQPL